MCDYSLLHVASRPARVGDKLVTTRFQGSITRGFAAVGKPNVAVCLLPGTEVAFEKNVIYDAPSVPLVGKLMAASVRQKTARFRQINADNQNAHHDALEFPDGQTVLVTRLVEGQRTTVLQLPTKDDRPKAEGWHAPTRETEAA